MAETLYKEEKPRVNEKAQRLRSSKRHNTQQAPTLPRGADE
ncbi:hypothetical protein [Solirubrum puertoriconensis]|nr:hypothetical protein [Solirubrum puertoriconensis]